MNQKINRDNYHRRRKRNIFKRFLLKIISGLARFSIPPKLRILLYRLMGVKIGKSVFIGMDCIIDSSYPELITIEEDVVISFRIMLICHGISVDPDGNAPGKQDRYVAGITLKKKCYIGAGAIILPGVVVGENAVIAAGAVVTHDVEPFTVVAGIPAKKIKNFNIDQ
jgi:acetyltransferase-like isoleucine patch superfamily enzyme